jgi:RimJ/RimL family protein N-acetyltransferase
VIGVVLSSERMELRPCETGDRDALHVLWTDPDVRRYLWDDRVIASSEAQAVIERSVESFERRGFGQWVAHPAGSVGDGSLMGFCGLAEVEDASEVELLYGFYPHHWGQGLATEASRLVLGHGFEALDLTRIVARTDPPNRASAQVMEALGMTFEWEQTVKGLPTLQYALARQDFLRTGGRREP